MSRISRGINFQLFSGKKVLSFTLSRLTGAIEFSRWSSDSSASVNLRGSWGFTLLFLSRPLYGGGENCLHKIRGLVRKINPRQKLTLEKDSELIPVSLTPRHARLFMTDCGSESLPSVIAINWDIKILPWRIQNQEKLEAVTWKLATSALLPIVYACGWSLSADSFFPRFQTISWEKKRERVLIKRIRPLENEDMSRHLLHP